MSTAKHIADILEQLDAPMRGTPKRVVWCTDCSRNGLAVVADGDPKAGYCGTHLGIRRKVEAERVAREKREALMAGQAQQPANVFKLGGK